MSSLRKACSEGSENRGGSGVYLSRILASVYDGLKFEEMKLCELLCKINFWDMSMRPARATNSYRKNRDVNVGKLGNLTEAQAGEKGMDMDALNSLWAGEDRVV